MLNILRVVTALLLLSLCFPGVADATVFIVDSQIDEPDANPGDGVCATATGACTLRAAVQEANRAERGVILVPGGVYTLTIPPVPGDPPAESGDLDASAFILGAGAKATIIDGGGVDRVFEVGGDESIRLWGVTVRNGSKAFFGGGIANLAFGDLYLQDVEVVGNSATTAGGGIYTYGGVTELRNVTIAGNSAGQFGGGAVRVSALENVTISGNTAPSGAGLAGLGGNFPRAAAVNVTIVANAADPGAGGGVFFRVDLGEGAFINSIIAGNPGGDCGGPDAVVSLGNNLSSDLTCNFFQPSDKPGVAPLVGPLQDNGGQTRTHGLRVGSPAIDSGNDIECPHADQRGRLRPADGDGNGTFVCDMGAFER